MNWYIKGDFNSKIISVGTLDREVTYVSITEQSRISQIVLLGYKCNSFIIQAHYKAPDDFASLADAIAAAGLPRPNDSLEKLKKFISLTTHDIETIGVFLSALIHLDPNINELVAIVSDNLRVKFDQAYRLPVWLVEGSFSFTFDSGAKLNRQVTYVSTIEQSIISKIYLLGYNDGDYGVQLHFKGEFAPLAIILERQNLISLTKPIHHDHSLRIQSSQRQLILLLLQALLPIQKNIEQAVVLISDALGFKLNFELKSLAFRQELNRKYNLDQTMLFSKMIPFLTLREQCKLSEICADHATIVAARNGGAAQSARFKRRFEIV